MPAGKRRFEEIEIDFVGELLESESFNSILVVTNRFTKVQHYIPAKTPWMAEDVVESYIHNIWKLGALPRYITLDSGPQFAWKFLKKLN